MNLNFEQQQEIYKEITSSHLTLFPVHEGRLIEGNEEHNNNLIKTLLEYFSYYMIEHVLEVKNCMKKSCGTGDGKYTIYEIPVRKWYNNRFKSDYAMKYLPVIIKKIKIDENIADGDMVLGKCYNCEIYTSLEKLVNGKYAVKTQSSVVVFNLQSPSYRMMINDELFILLMFMFADEKKALKYYNLYNEKMREELNK